MAENTKAAALKRATGTAKEEADPKAEIRARFDGVEEVREAGGSVKVGVLVGVYPLVAKIGEVTERVELRSGEVAKVTEDHAKRGESHGWLIRL